MGRRVQAEMKAFTLAEKKRLELIESLKKCDSFEKLESILNKYAQNKKKHVFDISGKLTSYHVGILKNLDSQIKDLIAEKSKAFPAPSVQSKSSEVSTEQLGSTTTSDTQEENAQKSNALANERIKIRRQRDLQKVLAQLDLILAKQGEFEQTYQLHMAHGNEKEALKYQKAASAAQLIHSTIKALSDKYMLDGDLASFKSECKKSLQDDRDHVKTLQEHRGWKSILANLAVFILTAGIAHAGYSLYNRELSLFKPATDASKKVAELEQSISNAITVAASA